MKSFVGALSCLLGYICFGADGRDELPVREVPTKFLESLVCIAIRHLLVVLVIDEQRTPSSPATS